MINGNDFMVEIGDARMVPRKAGCFFWGSRLWDLIFFNSVEVLFRIKKVKKACDGIANA